MQYPLELAIKMNNYKCFGEGDPQGFERLKNINIVIGRNNSGKSALLDILSYAIKPEDKPGSAHKGNAASVTLTFPLTELMVLHAVEPEHRPYLMQWVNTPFTVRRFAHTFEFISLGDSSNHAEHNQLQLLTRLANVLPLGLSNYKIRRILADRDISPEATGDLVLNENGSGATNAIQSFVNSHVLDSDLVESKMLASLNAIFAPHTVFERIVPQNKGDSTWEIYLDERDKGRISLSNSGSGLKTIFLVLVNLILGPVIDRGRELSNYIFAFEELENNLHPGLQRRLLSYLRDMSVQHDTCFVISTHSNVIIDLFSKDDCAQIIHVTHNGEYAEAKTVQTSVHINDVLDDLDVRASDLLQANAVVWVEGPSDRIYFNRWMDLFSNNILKEGTHYQCVFYGGRLLARLTAIDQEAEQLAEVNILKINRNAIILIDSDKRNQFTAINANKRRLEKEIRDVGGMSWISKGREVENYIPVEALRNKHSNTGLPPITKYEDMEEYLSTYLGKPDSSRYSHDKVGFAAEIVPHFTIANLQLALDLPARASAIVTQIKQWNNLPA